VTPGGAISSRLCRQPNYRRRGLKTALTVIEPVGPCNLTRPAFGRCAQWERFRLVLVAG
jgi:hypothetical protein